MAATKKELIADIRKHITNIWGDMDYTKVMLETVKTSQAIADLRELEFDYKVIDNIITKLEPKIEELMDAGDMEGFFTEEEQKNLVACVVIGKDIAFDHLLDVDIENNVQVACAWQHIANRIQALVDCLFSDE